MITPTSSTKETASGGQKHAAGELEIGTDDIRVFEELAMHPRQTSAALGAVSLQNLHVVEEQDAAGPQSRDERSDILRLDTSGVEERSGRKTPLTPAALRRCP